MKLWGNIVKGIQLVNKIDAHVIVLGSFNWSSEQQQQQKYHMCQYDICQSCGNCTEGTDSKQIDYFFFLTKIHPPFLSLIYLTYIHNTFLQLDTFLCVS